jgi:prepilin-type processing-associated H-X9-DG protein
MRRRKRIRAGFIITGTVIVLILAAILMPVSTGGGRVSPKTACLSNLMEQHLGLQIYASDQNDLLPPGPRWMDDLEPYVKNERIFHCSVVSPPTFGYALNENLAGTNLAKLTTPETTLLVFDAERPARSGLAPPSALPITGRHDGKNNVCYSDGHVKTLPKP